MKTIATNNVSSTLKHLLLIVLVAVVFFGLGVFIVNDSNQRASMRSGSKDDATPSLILDTKVISEEAYNEFLNKYANLPQAHYEIKEGMTLRIWKAELLHYFHDTMDFDSYRNICHSFDDVQTVVRSNFNSLPSDHLNSLKSDLSSLLGAEDADIDASYVFGVNGEDDKLVAVVIYDGADENMMYQLHGNISEKDFLAIYEVETN
ncbi:MAG: hypothetical protein Q4F39_07105 [Bacteroidia bacterium]|nr:hypothetical protein [Bacteroidia bacterium]